MTVATMPLDTPTISPFRAFAILFRWRVLQTRQELAQLLVMEVIFAAGIAVGFGFLIGDLDSTGAAYLATGALLMNMLMIAVALVPSTMTEARMSGALDYMWAQPFPRIVYLLSELSVWALVMLPGMVVSLVVTSLRFDFPLHVSPLVVPAMILILLTGTSVGAAIGLKAPSQQATNLYSNFVFITVLLFSPVNFPGDRLPGWLQEVHRVLPIAHMADLLRATLVGGLHTSAGTDLVVLSLWCAFGMIVTWRSVSRAG